MKLFLILNNNYILLIASVTKTRITQTTSYMTEKIDIF